MSRQAEIISKKAKDLMDLIATGQNQNVCVLNDDERQRAVGELVEDAFLSGDWELFNDTGKIVKAVSSNENQIMENPRLMVLMFQFRSERSIENGGKISPKEFENWLNSKGIVFDISGEMRDKIRKPPAKYPVKFMWES